MPILSERDYTFAEVSINGSELLNFILDTGAAVGAVRDDIVDKLDLTSQPPTVLNRAVTAPTYLAREIVVAGVIRRTNVALLRLPFAAPDIDGILDAGWFSSERSSISLDTGVWRILRRPTANLGPLTEIPSQFRAASSAVRTKRVYAEVFTQNVRGWALCDTGSPWPMVVSHAVGHRLNLWNDATPFAPVRAPRIGSDDVALCRLVRAPDVRLGAHIFKRR